MSTGEERIEIIEWLRWAETITAKSGRDTFPARRLLNAFASLEEGRSDPLMKPKEKSNSMKTKADRQVEALAIASVDALLKIGLSSADAFRKVREIAGPTITVDMRKKIASGKSDKYKGHGEIYDRARTRVTLGLQDRHLSPPSEETILNNLAVAVLITKGRI